MHRYPLITLLKQHQPADSTEQAMTQDTLSFVQANADCFERSLLIGHVTGSAWIVSPDRQKTVLIHHRKLDRWFQPGGHADGDPNIAGVAFREAEEETGLTSLKPISPQIYDVDVHPIPARGDVPEHLHYDIRFLLEADPNEPFILTDEVNAVRWLSMDEVQQLTDSESVLRMIRKMNSY
ncbi:NUDIX hydrolase [Spirosoma oryzicola]|uniref:NUDIX hydrolase n=1 Tax=Spirosoma oryzicola TaxID=2898794 RepID=UPI001E5DA3B9|nr:NUDIX hydrolase [Spirosoma oryzicola]UHG93094.1 NUDIX hydrolase [Spirosoma oryzicola]